MNALDSVRLVLNAWTTAERWCRQLPNLVLAVVAETPEHLKARYTPDEWVATVVIFMGEGHDPVDAARRLALYLTLHQERHNATPTLASVMKHAAARHIQENR